MPNWDDLQFLLAVYRAGTMSAAARELGTNVATVSRRIDRLAGEIGESPFVKTPNGWRPSPSIAGLLDAASHFDRMVNREQSEHSRFRADQLPQVRLGAPPMVISAVMLPHLTARISPIERVDLDIVTRIFETGLGGQDIVVQAGKPQTDRLASRKVGTLDFMVWSWRNAPGTDRWIGLSERHEPFEPLDRARAIFNRPPCVRLENFDKVFQASKLLRLPAPLPEVLARQESGLLRIDIANPPVGVDFWVMHHSSRLGEPAIEIVIEWIASAFEAVAAAMPREERASEML
jgi:DNA-binding transcriptional LysR family regulator